MLIGHSTPFLLGIRAAVGYTPLVIIFGLGRGGDAPERARKGC